MTHLGGVRSVVTGLLVVALVVGAVALLSGGDDDPALLTGVPDDAGPDIVTRYTPSPSAGIPTGSSSPSPAASGSGSGSGASSRPPTTATTRSTGATTSASPATATAAPDPARDLPTVAVPTATTPTTTATPAPRTDRPEAESGGFGGGAQVQGSPSASGGQVIGRLNDVGAFVEVGYVSEVSAVVTVVVRYSNGYPDERSLSLSVNGGQLTQLVFPPTGSWDSFTDSRASAVTVDAGANAIRLTRNERDLAAADIDVFVVTTGGR